MLFNRMANEKVYYDKYLLNIIKSYVPLSRKEKLLRKLLIIDLKLNFCEWSFEKYLCIQCMSYHPLFNLTGITICDDCYFGIIHPTF